MPLHATMSGVQLTRHGGPKALFWSNTIPMPKPGPGVVLVHGRAAGIIATDINARRGRDAPEVTSPPSEAKAATGGGWAGARRVPRRKGGDLYGRVVAHGPRVSAPPLGARVTCPINQPEPTPDKPRAIRVPGSNDKGLFAQVAVVPARHLSDVTAAPLSDAEMAARPCACGTALNLLTRAGVAARQRVLVTGALGGVGLAAVEIAAHRGAEVTALAQASKATVVRSMGAAQVSPRTAPLPPKRFGAARDVLGGEGFAALIPALRPRAKRAAAGAIAGPLVRLDLRPLSVNDITIHSCTDQSPALFDQFVTWIVSGRLRPLIAEVLPLSEIHRAQSAFLARARTGKIVLIPPEPSL